MQQSKDAIDTSSPGLRKNCKPAGVAQLCRDSQQVRHVSFRVQCAMCPVQCEGPSIVSAMLCSLPQALPPGVLPAACILGLDSHLQAWQKARPTLIRCATCKRFFRSYLLLLFNLAFKRLQDGNAKLSVRRPICPQGLVTKLHQLGVCV